MSKMNCKVCGTINSSSFIAKILNKYNVEYFHCKNCGFVQTQEPYWLEEAYAQSIKDCDTGHLARNLYFSKLLTIFIVLFLDRNGMFLDYAGGYGVFVRLMRDIGFNYYWNDKFTKNIFARGFETEFSHYKFELITLFECLEHLPEPLETIGLILENTDTFVFSTELLPKDLPQPDNWWYYLFSEGQHISFFSRKTLVFIAEKFSVSYANYGNLHFFSRKIKLNSLKIKALAFYRMGLHKLLSLKLLGKVQSDFDLIRK